MRCYRCPNFGQSLKKRQEDGSQILFANPSNNQAANGDSQLRGRYGFIEIMNEFLGNPRTAVPFLDLLSQPAAAGSHEGKFGQNEEGVKQNQNKNEGESE